MERSSANGASDIYARAWLCMYVCVFLFVCAHAFAHLWGGDIKITINDLQFSPQWNTSSVQVMTITSSLPLLLLFTSTPPPSLLPLPDSLTRPLCLFILPSFLFFPLSSPCLYCFRSATLWNGGKAFYIPHITAQLQSIAFMSAWIWGFARNMGTHLHARTHTY